MSGSFATPWTVAHQATLSMGVLQAIVPEWVAISFSRGSSQPRDQTRVSCIGKRILNHWATREAPGNDEIKKKKILVTNSNDFKTLELYRPNKNV